MATTHMPTYGCEHLNNATVSKIEDMRKTSTFDPDYVQYKCIACPATGGFRHLNDHFTESKHQFAVSPKAVYCGGCKDIIYDANISFQSNNGRKRKIIQRSKEDEEYLAANTLPTPCGRFGVRGLFNLGETCYMNAVLQMMVHNRQLQNYFLGMGHPLHTCPISKEPEKKNESDDSDDEMNGDENDQKTCVACGMTELFSDSAMVDQTVPAHAVNLLFASWKNISHMSGKGQQDAQEWFTIIVDKLHEAATNSQVISANAQCTVSNIVNRVPSKAVTRKSEHCDCFFHTMFYGRFESTITCDTCHEGKSDMNEEFSSLSLEFQKQLKRKKKEAKAARAEGAEGGGNSKKGKDTTGASSSSTDPKSQQAQQPIGLIQPNPSIPNLYDCLKSYTAPESLSAESYRCTSKKCNGAARAATKTFKIHKLPAILCIHVKRFGMKKVNGVLSGISEKYEGQLDFPLVLDLGPYTTADPKDVNWGGSAYGKFVYDLDCIVVHHGEHSHTGHYFAFCRVGGKVTGRKVGSSGWNLPSGRWYKFDDEIVSATTVEDVMSQEGYLLFYGLRDLFGSGSASGSTTASSANANHNKNGTEGTGSTNTSTNANEKNGKGANTDTSANKKTEN